MLDVSTMETNKKCMKNTTLIVYINKKSTY